MRCFKCHVLVVKDPEELSYKFEEMEDLVIEISANG